jgi:hypothetical protein
MINIPGVPSVISNVFLAATSSSTYGNVGPSVRPSVGLSVGP